VLKDDLPELTIDSWCCEGRGQDECDIGTIAFQIAMRGPKGEEKREMPPTQLEVHSIVNVNVATSQRERRGKKCYGPRQYGI
jgi:hypothetical protein